MMKRVLLAALLIAASVCAGWYAHSAREKVKNAEFESNRS